MAIRWRRSLADLLPTPPVPVPVHESADAFVARRGRGDLRLSVADPAARLAGPGGAGRAAARAGCWTRRCRRWCAGRRPRTTSSGGSATRTPGPWIRTAAWHVPVRWFVLFADEEREYTKGDEEARAALPHPMVQAGGGSRAG